MYCILEGVTVGERRRKQTGRKHKMLSSSSIMCVLLWIASSCRFSHVQEDMLLLCKTGLAASGVLFSIVAAALEERAGGIDSNNMGCFDLFTYGIEVKDCILESILGAEKLCEAPTDQDCFCQQSMTLGRKCLKPAFAKFMNSFDDPFKLSKTVQGTLLCTQDRVMEHAKTCFPPTHENISGDEEKEVIDIAACICENFPSSLRECYNLQHNHMTREL